MIDKDFFKLKDEKLKSLLRSKDTMLDVPDYLDERVKHILRNKDFSVKEEKKKLFTPVMKFAFSFAMLLIVGTSVFIGLNIFRNQKPVNNGLNSCIVKYINGSSYLLNETSGEKKKLSIGDKLDEHAVVVTENDSTVELEIDDNSVIMIKERSTLKTVKLFKDSSVKKTFLQLVKGEIFNSLEKLNEGSSFEVETKSVTVGVRGTKFNVKVSEENNVNVNVAEGKVYVKVNKSDELSNAIKEINQANADRINDALNETKIIDAGESLDVKYDEYIKEDKKLVALVGTVKAGIDKNENYIAEEKILKNIKEINEIILKIEKINKEDEKKLNESLSMISKIEKEKAKEKKPITSFTENFDTTPVGSLPEGWYLSKQDKDIFAGVVDSKTIKPYSMPNCLKLFDNSLTNAVSLIKQTGEHKYGQLKLNFYESAKSDSKFSVRILDDKLKSLSVIEFTSAGIINLIDETSTPSIINKIPGSIKSNEWNELIIRYDRDSGYINFALNNINLTTIKLNGSGMPGNIELKSGSYQGNVINCTAYVDNIEFTTKRDRVEAEKPKEKTASPFSENFDSTPVGSLPEGWYMTDKEKDKDIFAGVVNSKEIKPYSMPNSLKLFDNSTNSAVYIYKDVGFHDYGQLKFYLYGTSYPSSTFCYFKILDQSGKRIAAISFENKNMIAMIKKGGDNLITSRIGDYEYEKWNKIIIKYDSIAGYININCNDANLGTYELLSDVKPYKLSFQGGKALSIAENSTVYLDNIEFTTNKETVDPKNKKAVAETSNKDNSIKYDVIKTTVIKSEGPGKDAYKMLNEFLGTGSFHSPDYEGYHKGIKHITMEKDSEVGNYFKFIVHRDIDKYSSGKNFQNKVSLYLNKNAPNNTLAYKNDVFRYYFKMKVHKDMAFSKNFTAFFSLAPFVGNNLPKFFLFSLDAVKNNNKDLLRIYYAPVDKMSVLSETDFSKIRDKWIHAECIIKYADKGFVQLSLKDLSGTVLFTFEKDNFLLWRENVEYFAPNWTLLRTLGENETFRAEEDEVDFADMTIQKIKLK